MGRDIKISSVNKKNDRLLNEQLQFELIGLLILINRIIPLTNCDAKLLHYSIFKFLYNKIFYFV